VTAARTGHLYLEAARRARPRQLVARALRPVRRRRTGAPPRTHELRPLGDPVELWRSPAFDGGARVEDGEIDLLGKRLPYPPPEWNPLGLERLRRFHLHYGEEVLHLARRGDGDGARRAARAWIEGNPPARGDGWHPYPLSTRVGNWIAAASLAPGLADATFADSLWRQLAYLERNVEDDVLGNHVIRNARALVLGGVAFGADKLERHGFALLERELPEQVLPDGGHYERSPTYHLIVLRDLLEIRAASGAVSLDAPIERMRGFAAAVARPDGRPAPFNDGGLDLAPELELPAPPHGLTVFPDTGYAVVREGRLWLAFDCGPPAPRFLPPHAHADGLSFQVWISGRPLVVDSGTYTYEAGRERDWFRGTRAHATVSVDGRDQFESWGAFRTGPLPDVRLLSVEPLAAQIRTSKITHRRTIRWRAELVQVEDELEGRGRHLVESRLPLAPGSDAGCVEPAGLLPASLEEGWLSERLFERTPAPVVVARGEVDLPVRLGWRITIKEPS
jgi:Heparinase II/III-like protein/Heparinase II/III N-terminus